MASPPTERLRRQDPSDPAVRAAIQRAAERRGWRTSAAVLISMWLGAAFLAAVGLILWLRTG